jgi:hypothetical protein
MDVLQVISKLVDEGSEVPRSVCYLHVYLIASHVELPYFKEKK